MESHQEPRAENPNKTLETTKNTVETQTDLSPVTSPPSVPPPQASEIAGDGGGGEDPRDVKPSGSDISDLEKKQRRAERFGMPVQISEEEKRSSRADRFGTGIASFGKTGVGKLEEEKRKARAERFGLTGQSPVDVEAKKKARTERFIANPVPFTPEEEEKRKARALRFSGTTNAASEANGKANSELKAAVAETSGEVGV